MSCLDSICRLRYVYPRRRPRFNAARPDHVAQRHRAGPGLEQLEARTVLSTINLAVTSLADSGPGSLRAAIAQADSGSAGNAYKIRFKVRGTITLESALPDLTRSMNLIGSGVSRLTVQRDSMALRFRIFVVDTGVNVAITGMTIARGSVIGIGVGGGIDNNGTLALDHTAIVGSFADQGGGIENNGTLTASHITIDSNLAQSGGGIGNTGSLKLIHTVVIRNQTGAENAGGGIFNTGTLTGRDATISANLATASGGGIYNTGLVVLNRAVVAGNTVDNGQASMASPPSHPSGGGIYNTGTFTVSHVTLSSNSAQDGGGIYNGGKLTLSDGVISHGVVGNAGGGIYNTALLTLSHATLSFNEAMIQRRFARPTGGGIDNTSTGLVTMNRTTFDRNDAITGGGLYNSGVIIESRNNFSRNHAAEGAGVYNDGSLIENHDDLSRNVASIGNGGAIDNTGSLSVRHTNVARNSAVIGGGLYNSGGGHAEVDVSTLNDAVGGGLVNNTSGIGDLGSTVHVKKTVVDHVFYADKVFS